MALIFFFSHNDAPNSTAHSDGAIQMVANITNIELSEFTIRKLAHSLIYLILGALIIWSLLPLHRKEDPHRRRRLSLLILISLSTSILYAISDEFHQTFIPGRSGEVGDVLLDSTSALIGIYLVVFMYQKITSRNPASLKTE